MLNMQLHEMKGQFCMAIKFGDVLGVVNFLPLIKVKLIGPMAINK